MFSYFFVLLRKFGECLYILVTILRIAFLKSKFKDRPCSQILVIFQTGVLFWDGRIEQNVLKLFGDEISVNLSSISIKYYYLPDIKSKLARK